MTVVLNESSFADEIKSGVVLVDFWAEWCGPCQMMIPILDELTGVMGDKAKVAKVNVDENPALAAQFRVMSIPTMIIFKDGKPVEQIVGVRQVSELKEILEVHI
ncbi:MAG: thioredoxin [Candidatus Gracilibacteria bacterium]|nr:thioredoxin [Candidatus Gracilibacteria bacterium]